MRRWLSGIDEVGRGPLAGPVGVGVVCVPARLYWARLSGVADSKRLTAAKREAVAKRAKQLARTGCLRYRVSLVSAPVIDRLGINPAIALAIQRALKRLNVPPADCVVKLDGGLRAPAHYTKQVTIVGGDAREPVIALASIVAKVRRDRYLTRLSKQASYAPYGFAKHKGYGTKTHRGAIVTHGLSNQHRQQYCKKLLGLK